MNPSLQNPSELFTPFLPTTYELPEENDRLRTFLGDSLNVLSDVVNDKKIGVITQASENFNGNKFYYITPRITRNGYQTLAYIPSYPNAGVLTLTIATNPQYPIQDVNPEFVITNLWGTASKPCSATGAGDGDYFKFNNQGDSRISFTMSDTTIVITTTVDLTLYNGFIIIEYLRNGL